MPPSTPPYTPEQQAIALAARSTTDNLLVQARAGSGKTFILCNAIVPVLKGTTLLMAFNKSIASELEARTNHLSFEVRAMLAISTVHAAGLRAFKSGSGQRNPKVNGGKVSFILKDILAQDRRRQDTFAPATALVKQLIGIAKSSGFGVTSPYEPFASIDDDDAWLQAMQHFNLDLDFEAKHIAPAAAISLAQETLRISNNQQHIIDFDDMIYLPLLLQHHLPTYDNVLLDEAQDISPLRREFAFKSLNPGGRLIAVGDEFQAIYGFTGADAASLVNIGRRAAATELSLTTCFRCDEAIIAEAQHEVPDIVAKQDAGLGTVSSLQFEDLLAQLSTPDGDNPLTPRPGDAILCRLNRPNVSMALALLRAGKRARIEGRDLGARLLQHIKSCNARYAFTNLHTLLIDLEEYGAEQCRLLAERNRMAASDLLADEIACASLMIERALEQGGTEFTDVEAEVGSLFADDIPPSGTVTLSSIHKAKGREWPRVYILGYDDYMPFHRATADWELQQETNLIYVAKTRAEHHLIYINDVQRVLEERRGRND